LMRMDFTGLSPYNTLSNQDRSLDIMSTKYLITTQSLPTEETKADLRATVPNGRERKTFWPENSFSLSLGGLTGSKPNLKSTLIDLPKMSIPTTEIALNTLLSNSVAIPNNTVVMNIRIFDIDGNIENHPFLAGRDTSEQAFDCLDIKPLMQHKRAEIYDTTIVDRPGIGSCSSHSYKTIIKLDKPHVLKQLQLQFIDPLAQISILRISLRDSSIGLSLPIQTLQPPVTMTKWREIEHLGDGGIYENQQVLPRAWVVSKVLQLKPEEILQTVRTSRLPNGQLYQPEKIALVETNDNSFNILAMQSSTIPSGKAEILRIADTKVEVQTDSGSPAFLVLSDVNYPGWLAWVDDQPTKIFQTNYIQRGVNIPAGEHIVRFEFHPLSFKLGTGISISSVFIGLYALTRVKSMR
jgi:Bacterial membrane protein YfhO